MTGTLRQARILSSETDNTIKQNQETNVNINIKPHHERRASTVPLYPNPQVMNSNVNFTQVNPQTMFREGGITSDTQMIHEENSAMKTNPESAYQYQPPINNQSLLARERGIADLGSEIDELDKKNRFLEMIVEMYENNPLKVNSYVVCESRLLMEMIKLLTDCDKVDLVLNDNIAFDGGCCAMSGKSNGSKSDKIIYVSKILITKDGKSEDLKYCRNDIYSEFIRYGISMKMVM